MPTTDNPQLQELYQELISLLYKIDSKQVREFLDIQHPADIADLLEILDEQQRVLVFDALNIETAAEVLDETRTDTLRDIVEHIPSEKIAELLDQLPMDDAAEILSEVDPELAGELLALMEPSEAAEVQTILAYPEQSAGRLMTSDIVRLEAKWTAQQAVEFLRTIDPEVELLTYLYVVNGGGKLMGVVPLRKLITAPSEQHIESIMIENIVTVLVDADQEEVARVMRQYDFFAVPVTDSIGTLMGIVTHDDVMDIVDDEFTEDVQRFGGSAPLEKGYLSTSIPKMVQKRIGWLFLLFFTAQLTTGIMHLYEDRLQSVVALSFFIPLLIGTGGNAGSQMTATMIRAVAVGEVRFGDIWRVVGRELVTGLLLGLGMAGAGVAFSSITGYPFDLALTVGLSLLALVIWANLMGVLLPILADRVNVDPTVISGPVMSTLVDATGLLIYFSLAGLILGI